jgi:NAD(P)H dehydrogenase (quinone)
MMARVLIVHDSEREHRENGVRSCRGRQGVKNVEVIVKKVVHASLDDLCSADGIIMGSLTYYGQMSGKLKSFIVKSEKIHGKLDGKVGAAFTSAGGTATGAETTLFSILETMLVHGMIIQGRYDDKHFGPTAVGIPKAKEIEYCQELGRRVAGLVLRLRR